MAWGQGPPALAVPTSVFLPGCRDHPIPILLLLVGNFSQDFQTLTWSVVATLPPTVHQALRPLWQGKRPDALHQPRGGFPAC